MADNKCDTKQTLKFDANGNFAKGTGVPAGFNKYPEHRHNGSWKKENTPRYWLETMMNMQESELREIYSDEKNSLFKRKLARCIKEGGWKEIEKMINQVYGMPKQTVENRFIEKPQPLEDLRDKSKKKQEKTKK